jgi:predicted HicB family RNase H-like nuclease
MPQSKAHIEATARYEKKAYDKYQIRMKKGQLDVVKTHATNHGESVNGFINRAIAETMKREETKEDSGNA